MRVLNSPAAVIGIVEEAYATDIEGREGVSSKTEKSEDLPLPVKYLLVSRKAT